MLWFVQTTPACKYKYGEWLGTLAAVCVMSSPSRQPRDGASEPLGRSASHWGGFVTTFNGGEKKKGGGGGARRRSASMPVVHGARRSGHGLQLT